MCRNVRSDEGVCSFGDQCNFAHSKDELREDDLAVSHEKRASGRQRGAAKSDAGGSRASSTNQAAAHRRHMARFKTQICRYITQGLPCQHGDLCTYAHTRQEVSACGMSGFEVRTVGTITSLTGPPPLRPSCPPHRCTTIPWRQLESNLGDRYKTKLCRMIADGDECPNGDGCSFAHDVDELRYSPPPVSPMDQQYLFRGEPIPLRGHSTCNYYGNGSGNGNDNSRCMWLLVGLSSPRHAGREIRTSSIVLFANPLTSLT